MTRLSVNSCAAATSGESSRPISAVRITKRCMHPPVRRSRSCLATRASVRGFLVTRPVEPARAPSTDHRRERLEPDDHGDGAAVRNADGTFAEIACASETGMHVGGGGGTGFGGRYDGSPNIVHWKACLHCLGKRIGGRSQSIAHGAIAGRGAS